MFLLKKKQHGNVKFRKRTDDRLFQASHNSLNDNSYIENITEFDLAIHHRSEALKYFISHSVNQCAHCGATTYNKLQAGYRKMRIPTASCCYRIKTGRTFKTTRYHIPALSDYTLDGFQFNSYDHILDASYLPFM